MLKKIFNDKNFRFIVFFSSLFLCGLYLFFDRPVVKNTDDLTTVRGKLDHVSKEHNPYSKSKTDFDILYYIYLDNYACHFQVSYMPFDVETFYKNSQSGDLIELSIPKEDLENLNNLDANVRSFSLKVNEVNYLQVKEGIRGFGGGYFEISICLISLIGLTYLIVKATRR